MITVNNASLEKKRFFSMFPKDCYVNIQLIPYVNCVLLRITGVDSNVFFEVKCSDNTPITYKLNIPNVHITDCVFDLLFNTNGFYIAVYKSAYTELKPYFKNACSLTYINEDNPTIGNISQVIIKTKRRTTSFMLPCNHCFQMIDTGNNEE